MSGAPKRSHEESGHSSSSKYPHEDSGACPKLPPSVSNEYHQPHEMGQDSRLAKIPRTESRDADRRSPLLPVYRRPYAAIDLPSDPPIPSENKLESRDSKETRDLRFENRDKKTETREPYSEVRRDTPNAKVEKDVRHDSRGDDNKEVKSERENYNDGKADLKAEGYGVASSHLNYKESKEYHRGKIYSDPPVGSTDTWHRNTSQSHVEVGKEAPTTEERDHVEAHEAVGENRYDSKGEDKFKDKDRKRKDLKHRDWGERDKERSDRRSNVLVANSSSDFKDSAKEERDSERWEPERRDTAKAKEILKERERDHTKRDAWSGVEKDGSNTEKEVGDGSIRMTEHETLPPEQKKQKDFESWRTADRESRDRRKERDVDAEGDRPEKRMRTYDKELDDGCADGEAATDKEREVYSYAVQQRKRMQRSRAAPANRELRFRSHTQDNEGCVYYFSLLFLNLLWQQFLHNAQFHILRSIVLV